MLTLDFDSSLPQFIRLLNTRHGGKLSPQPLFFSVLESDSPTNLVKWITHGEVKAFKNFNKCGC